MSMNDLREKLKEYQDLKAMANELQDMMDNLVNEIKAYMGDNEELTVDGIKVMWTRYKAKRFDTTTFAAEHTAMYEQYIKTTDTRRFCVA